jgi:hypothetical protein
VKVGGWRSSLLWSRSRLLWQEFRQDVGLNKTQDFKVGGRSGDDDNSSMWYYRFCVQENCVERSIWDHQTIPISVYSNFLLGEWPQRKTMRRVKISRHFRAVELTINQMMMSAELFHERDLRITTQYCNFKHWLRTSFHCQSSCLEMALQHSVELSDYEWK